MRYSATGRMTSMPDNQIFCVTSARSVGCTFLDWSIYYLSAQPVFYQANQQSWLPLSIDPLMPDSHNIAHRHPKNHPSGSAGIKSLVKCLRQANRDDFKRSFYPVPMYIDVACQQLGITLQQIPDPKVLAQINQHIQQDYEAGLNWVTNQEIPLVYVSVDQQAHGYFWQIRSLDRLWSKPGRADSVDSIEQEQQDIFFRDSQQVWSKLNLTQTWDRRERLALDMRPFDPLQYRVQTFAFAHHWVNCQDLWFDTERTIERVMSWLEIAIHSDRLLTWKSIARRWQQQHNDFLRFYRMLPEIVAAIVRGHDFELPSLSLQQEAIVLHCLIYQHGLNLKSWQLENFPSNTLKLHDLLEPNIHPIESYSNHLL